MLASTGLPGRSLAGACRAREPACLALARKLINIIFLGPVGPGMTPGLSRGQTRFVQFVPRTLGQTQFVPGTNLGSKGGTKSLCECAFLLASMACVLNIFKGLALKFCRTFGALCEGSPAGFDCANPFAEPPAEPQRFRRILGVGGILDSSFEDQLFPPIEGRADTP